MTLVLNLQCLSHPLVLFSYRLIVDVEDEEDLVSIGSGSEKTKGGAKSAADLRERLGDKRPFFFWRTSALAYFITESSDCLPFMVRPASEESSLIMTIIFGSAGPPISLFFASEFDPVSETCHVGVISNEATSKGHNLYRCAALLKDGYRCLTQLDDSASIFAALSNSAASDFKECHNPGPYEIDRQLKEKNVVVKAREKMDKNETDFLRASLWEESFSNMKVKPDIPLRFHKLVMWMPTKNKAGRKAQVKLVRHVLAGAKWATSLKRFADGLNEYIGVFVFKRATGQDGTVVNPEATFLQPEKNGDLCVVKAELAEPNHPLAKTTLFTDRQEVICHDYFHLYRVNVRGHNLLARGDSLLSDLMDDDVAEVLVNFADGSSKLVLMNPRDRTVGGIGGNLLAFSIKITKRKTKTKKAIVHSSLKSIDPSKAEAALAIHRSAWIDPHERPVPRPLERFFPGRYRQFDNGGRGCHAALLWRGRLRVVQYGTGDLVMERQAWISSATHPEFAEELDSWKRLVGNWGDTLCAATVSEVSFVSACQTFFPLSNAGIFVDVAPDWSSENEMKSAEAMDLFLKRTEDATAITILPFRKANLVTFAVLRYDRRSQGLMLDTGCKSLVEYAALLDSLDKRRGLINSSDGKEAYNLATEKGKEFRRLACFLDASLFGQPFFAVVHAKNPGKVDPDPNFLGLFPRGMAKEDWAQYERDGFWSGIFLEPAFVDGVLGADWPKEEEECAVDYYHSQRRPTWVDILAGTFRISWEKEARAKPKCMVIAMCMTGNMEELREPKSDMALAGRLILARVTLKPDQQYGVTMQGCYPTKERSAKLSQAILSKKQSNLANASIKLTQGKYNWDLIRVAMDMKVEAYKRVDKAATQKIKEPVQVASKVPIKINLGQLLNVTPETRKGFQSYASHVLEKVRGKMKDADAPTINLQACAACGQLGFDLPSCGLCGNGSFCDRKCLAAGRRSHQRGHQRDCEAARRKRAQETLRLAVLGSNQCDTAQ